MPRLRTAGPTLLAVLALGVAGAGASAVARPAVARPAAAVPSVASVASVASISFGSCASSELRSAGATCGRLSVPLDYGNPTGAKISIAVSRIKATAPSSTRLGPLLVNPGGPGGDGLRYSAHLKKRLPASVSSRFDLIGFDPRGVGASRPRLSCLPNYAKGPRPDYQPRTGSTGAVSSTEKAWLARSAKYAAACAEKYPALLPRMRTIDAVRDIEMIRRSLGATRISFYGYSYGTYLAQVYATTYPNKTRRLVLDGVVDPRYIWYTAQLKQDVGFEIVIRRFFGWVAKYDSTYHLGDTATKVSNRYYAERAKLRTTPRGQIGPSEWTDVFLPAGYSQSTWPTLAAALRLWVRGERAEVNRIYTAVADVGDDNGFAVYSAVQCADATWPKAYATWRSDAFATAAKAPFETWGNVWFNTPCIYWKAPQGVPVNVHANASALLVTTLLDAATPYAGAIEVRRRFPNSALVAEEGNTTHTAGLLGNRCIDDRIIRYLKTGDLPTRKSGTRRDVTCPRRPAPHP